MAQGGASPLHPPPRPGTFARLWGVKITSFVLAEDAHSNKSRSGWLLYTFLIIVCLFLAATGSQLAVDTVAGFSRPVYRSSKSP